MMNIGIACHPTHGGSGVVATELGKNLAKRGHSIHFITYEVPFRLGSFDRKVCFHSVETNQYAVFKYPPQELALANRMAQVAKEYHLDVMHVHYAIPYSICALLAKQMVNHSFRLITTLHGTDVTILGEDPSLKSMIEFGINQSDAVTAVSDSLVQQTEEQFSIQVPIKRIYNFVDQAVYYPRDMTAERQKFAEPNEKILLHISNFRPVKRVKDVVAIFNLIQKKQPAKLLLVGGGPDLPAVTSYINELGLSSKVMILGKQDEVSSLFSLADLLLLPSAKESFGMVAIEAMACGVPVISSDVGGLPEVIEHGKTGFLAPIGDVESMAEQALLLLQRPVLYELFSLRGIEQVKRKFTMESIVDQYEALYKQVLARGGDTCGQNGQNFCPNP